MSLFFSGAVTSSPIKRRLRASCQSLDVSLLSPDSSYICYPSVDGSHPCSCRRSPRLLTNGYYSVTDDSFSWDDDGNVLLNPCRTNVSYKENLVRIFRRRRRPRGSLVGLLSDVTDSCQSWLDEKVFRGVFRKGQNQDQNWDHDQTWDRNWDWISPDIPAELEETWSGFKMADLDDGRDFMYDHTEVPPPSDKVAPPRKLLIQEEICSEICQSQEGFTQILAGLAEVPPASRFYTDSCCCRASPEPTGLTVKTCVLLIIIFISTALISRCLLWSAAVAFTVFLVMLTFMCRYHTKPDGSVR